jgi:hypothetical protein
VAYTTFCVYFTMISPHLNFCFIYASNKQGDIRFKVTFLLEFRLFSWNILKVNLCINIHIYIKRFLFFFSLSSTKGKENEGDSIENV